MDVKYAYALKTGLFFGIVLAVLNLIPFMLFNIQLLSMAIIIVVPLIMGIFTIRRYKGSIHTSDEVILVAGLSGALTGFMCDMPPAFALLFINISVLGYGVLTNHLLYTAVLMGILFSTIEVMLCFIIGGLSYRIYSSIRQGNKKTDKSISN